MGAAEAKAAILANKTALIGLNGGTRKMRERYDQIDRELLPLLPNEQTVLRKKSIL